MRYFLDISYLGTAFHGWQIQPNAHTVQAELQKALSTIYQKEVEIVGSGRTDTGVHASQQIAHFDSEPISDLPKLQYRMNGLLPVSISINDIRPVTDEAHARFDASMRTYHYHIHKQKSPFKEGLSYFYPKAVDSVKINEALTILKNWKNFQAFSKVHTDVNHFDCDIFAASWVETNENHVFSVSANRFLRGMVRAIVGTMLEVGHGKISSEDLVQILNSENRSNAGRAVPPQGLYLTEVKYPETIFI